MNIEEAQELAAEKAEAIMAIRHAILNALPDEGNTDEVTIAGLSLFLQAALHMAEGDVEKVNLLVNHVIELSMAMNSHVDHENQTVH